MLLLAGIVAGIVVGLLQGGKLANLGKIHLRWAWIAVLALVIQAILIRVRPDWDSAARVFFPLTHAVILGVAWINRDLDGMWLVAAGTALNFIVMVVNGGFMPITPEVVVQAGLAEDTQSIIPNTRLTSSKGLILSRDEIALWWLGDVIALRFIRTIVSVGDVLIAPGISLFVRGAMLQRED